MLDIVLGEENKSPKKKEVLDQIQDYFPESLPLEFCFLAFSRIYKFYFG